MRNRLFLLVVMILAAGFVGMIIYTKTTKPVEEKLGVLYANQGQEHIERGAKHDAYNSSPATSGPHYADNLAPAPWGIYTEEIEEEVFIHNEEHGGIVVTYNPALLPPEQLQKLQSLFSPPYENKNFQPTKFIVTPRAKNTEAIQLAAWRYVLKLDSYDEAKIKTFYAQRIGKAPEAFAGPTNKPINQAATK